MPPRRRPHLFLLLALAACGDVRAPADDAATEGPRAIRLVERFADARVTGTPTDVPEVPAGTHWRFDREGDGWDWEVVHEVDDLAVVDGALTGRSTGVPLIHAARPEGMDETDLLHAVEIRMRASDGTRLGVSFSGADEFDAEAAIEQATESTDMELNVDLTPGEEFRTYTLTAADSRFSPSFEVGEVEHVVLRPTNHEDATFAIDSMRLVSRREHLAQVPSGPGWHGLADVYRESIVARAPERVAFDVDVPRDAFLDLAIGTIEDGPVTFVVEAGGSRLLRRTLTTRERWTALRLDLAPGPTELAFALEAETPGAIGYWGAPVVRRRGDAQGVVLVLMDTLRRDHLQPYGYARDTAPVLQRLADEGALFADAIAQGAWTKVSVPAILTSLYPRTHGIVDMADRLPASVDTLAEVFRRAGYATWASSSVPFSGKLSNLHQGVEVLHERKSVRDLPREHRAKTARTFVDRLLPWIEDHRDVPFFAFLHVFDPHSPYEPFRPYDARWAEPGEKAAHEELLERVREFMDDEHMKGDGLPNADELAEAEIAVEDFIAYQHDLYDGSIRQMDAEIGRLVERLDALGLDDDVLLAFVSDHGEAFLERGKPFHGDTVHGEMVNVPLMLHWPGVVPAGVVVDETVQTIDLYPTVLDLVGLPVPERVQGRSLVPRLQGAAGWQRRPAFSEAVPMPSILDPDDDGRESYAVVHDGWKLVHNVVAPADVPEYELYDHDADPFDLTDVAAEHPEVVARLAERLETWRAAALEARVSADEDVESMDPATLAELRALGYLR